MVNKACASCKCSLPLGEFGKSKAEPDGRNSVCRKCRRDKEGERRLMGIERQVRILYGGRCALCGTNEGLEIIPAMKTRRLNAKAMVLICSACKREGVPTLTKFSRKCFRCNHVWIAQKEFMVRCPKCRTPYWHVPREKT